MCQVLQVSHSGYYAWQLREECERSRRDQVLLKEIRNIHHESKETYGAIKIWEARYAKQELTVASTGRRG
jgi:transposase InsO family protein